MGTALKALFLLSVISAFGGFLYALYEFLALGNRLLQLSGPTFMRSTIPFAGPLPQLQIGESREGGRAVYVFVSPTECMFREQFSWPAIRSGQPLGLTGQMKFTTDRVEVTARIRLGAVIFIAAWLAGWTFGGLHHMLIEQPFDYFPLLFGWGGMCLCLLVLAFVERTSFPDVIDDVLADLREIREDRANFMKWPTTK